MTAERVGFGEIIFVPCRGVLTMGQMGYNPMPTAQVYRPIRISEKIFTIIIIVLKNFRLSVCLSEGPANVSKCAFRDTKIKAFLDHSSHPIRCGASIFNPRPTEVLIRPAVAFLCDFGTVYSVQTYL